MKIEYRFLSFAEIRNNLFDLTADPELIFQSGLELYRAALLDHPYCKDINKHAACVALVDGKIVGRIFLFRSLLKVGEQNVPIQTSGGLLVSEKYRGLGIGISLIQIPEKNELHCAALFTRAAYNIRKKSHVMFEIPQYVKIRYFGMRRILDFPIILRQIKLKRRLTIKKLSVVPTWAGAMATIGSHKYMEAHMTDWLQWALDHTATGNELDYQSFYAIYDKEENPVGFFMTKVRHITKEGKSLVKANLIEWASVDIDFLDEADINILSLSTLDSSVTRFWTISENVETGKKLKMHLFKRRGWFAMSIPKDDIFKDIGDVNLWRIRYGCFNTALVE